MPDQPTLNPFSTNSLPANPFSPGAGGGGGLSDPPFGASAFPMPVPGEAATPLHTSDLSVLGMFTGADIIVQTVMVLLALASVITWTIGLLKAVELTLAIRRTRALGLMLNHSGTLNDAVRDMEELKGVEKALVTAALAELERSSAPGPFEAELDQQAGLKERLVSTLERLEAAAGRSVSLGMGFLASVGATSPFIGLFGTVWGIMNSFISISKTQTTNLAVVAPGIAEALLATALGLVAAIPAVILYNLFSRRLGVYKARLREVSSGIMRLISRDLDRHTLVIGRPLYTTPQNPGTAGPMDAP